MNAPYFSTYSGTLMRRRVAGHGEVAEHDHDVAALAVAVQVQRDARALGDVAQLRGVGLRVDQERLRAVPEEPDGHRLGRPVRARRRQPARCCSSRSLRSARCAERRCGVDRQTAWQLLLGGRRSLGAARAVRLSRDRPRTRPIERIAHGSGALDPREVTGAAEHLDRGRGPMACAVSVDAVTGIGLPAPCTSSVGTAMPGRRAASAGSSACSDSKVAGVGLDRGLMPGNGGAGGGVAK